MGGLVRGVMQCVITHNKRCSSRVVRATGVTASPAIWVRSLLSPREPNSRAAAAFGRGFFRESVVSSLCACARAFSYTLYYVRAIAHACARSFARPPEGGQQSQQGPRRLFNSIETGARC